MNQWGDENEYDRAKAKSERRTERMAKYRVVKAPLTDEKMIAVYSSIYGAGTERENLIEMGRAVERAHGIGEEK